MSDDKFYKIVIYLVLIAFGLGLMLLAPYFTLGLVLGSIITYNWSNIKKTVTKELDNLADED